MRVKFYTKNWAVIAERTFPTTHVPRVGELIDAGAILPEEEVSDFFVTEVVYEASADGFVPVVSCRQWLQGDRAEELIERGWLRA